MSAVLSAHVTIYKISRRTHHAQAPSELHALSKPAVQLHKDRGMPNVMVR